MEVQSQFIEMFGGEKYPLVRLGQYTNLNWGDTKTTKASYVLSGYQAYSASGPDGLLDHYDYDCEGIVLSAIGADCGKTWFAKGKWSCIKNTIRFWSISNELDNAFLFFATNKKEFWPRRGGAQPFIPQGDARNCTIPLPPMAQQQQFVSIAEQADKSKFVGFKSQFIEMFGGVTVMKSLCEICRPKQWPTIPTKDFTEEGYLVYGANGVIGHYSQFNHEMPTILMACRGASCGAINISEPKSYITGNAMCMDNIDEQIEFEYLAYFLSNYDYKTIITGGAQPQITVTNLQKVLVPIPLKERQKEFSRIYQQADKSKLVGHCSMNAMNAGISKLINKKISTI